MDLFQLGQSAKRLTAAVVARDWMSALREVGTGYQAVEEFIAGWQSDHPVPVGAAGPGSVDEELAALRSAIEECEKEPAAAFGTPVGAALDPGTILFILQAVKTFVDLLAELRRRRAEG